MRYSCAVTDISPIPLVLRFIKRITSRLTQKETRYSLCTGQILVLFRRSQIDPKWWKMAVCAINPPVQYLRKLHIPWDTDVPWPHWDRRSVSGWWSTVPRHGCAVSDSPRVELMRWWKDGTRWNPAPCRRCAPIGRICSRRWSVSWTPRRWHLNWEINKWCFMIIFELKITV